MLVILSWVGFWINREATGDRIALGTFSLQRATGDRVAVVPIFYCFSFLS